MLDTGIILTIAAVFLLAGAVKGVIGFGLPTVSLALVTAVLDLPSAMALLLVPSFVTNLWQASVGGNGSYILQRIWPFLSMACLTVWLGATALKHVDLLLLSALLGSLLLIYATVSMIGVRFSISIRQQVWCGPLIGVLNGIFTGMTGSFVIPGVMYLQAIGLSRNRLIQAMGMLFTVSTLALAAALQQNKLLTLNNGMLSLAALLPALLGLFVGQQIRQHLSEDLFRKLFFISLLMLGAYIFLMALEPLLLGK